MKILISTLLTLILLTSCNTINTIKLLRIGEVEQEEYFVKLPFEYRFGLIILKVDIAGTEYDFLLDTGAPNVISVELAEILNLTNQFEQRVEDGQDNDSNLGFVKIEKMDIGGIHFLNTGAAVADLNQSKEIACLKIHGLIGSNLMKKAIWKFDYQNQIVTISNSIESFEIPNSSIKASFSTELTGTPVVIVKLDDVKEKNVIIDLGSNGGVSLSKESFNEIIKNDHLISRTYRFGNSGTGLYGEGSVDSTHYIKTPSISVGDVTLENHIVSFKDNSVSTIGNDFFENYDLILNWFTKEIILINRQELNNSTFSNFGFVYSNHDNQLIVSSIYEKMEDLKIGDQILEIDGKRYHQLSIDQWCRIIEDGLFENDRNEIRISILRKNRELNFILKKVELL